MQVQVQQVCARPSSANQSCYVRHIERIGELLGVLEHLLSAGAVQRILLHAVVPRDRGQRISLRRLVQPHCRSRLRPDATWLALPGNQGDTRTRLFFAEHGGDGQAREAGAHDDHVEFKGAHCGPVPPTDTSMEAQTNDDRLATR